MQVLPISLHIPVPVCFSNGSCICLQFPDIQKQQACAL